MTHPRSQESDAFNLTNASCPAKESVSEAATSTDGADQHDSHTEAATNQVLAQLTERYHALGRQTKLVADYVLKNPKSVVLLSIAELADQCQVSQFTVTHLCKTIGLSGYQELKLALSRTFIKPLENIHEEIGETDQIPDIATKLAESHIASIHFTRQNVDMQQVKRVVDALAVTGRVDIYGMGNAGVAAQSALNKFFRLGLDVRVPQDSHLQSMYASLLKPGDVAIGISTAGSSKDVLDAMRQAKQAGATTVALTSRAGSPLAKTCELKLITTSQESMYRSESMENLIAQIYLLDVLYVSVAMLKKDMFLNNLQKTRKALLVKKV
ncbi:MurR/RpiR family transcriptional regulator [Propionispora hippei]|uniref:Transcriptional regulator, RpiR family n=1 Tax=Propionispora hippei DSM 15287 TaxID=1123003 RepID=A0A1M6HY82_9FIRM|nr:MurR/RpiR family transcriptional regulator [Propionispora hippei]SHJ27179.1 transcriptional regulator, RpiR family [Propionispora hippei DSM 15287]